jgi:DNA gyrase/topoisomerase IV subunit A
VKRVDLSTLAQKPQQPVISLKDGDRVIGAGIAAESSWLCFVTDHAQLLRFPADQVRAQGAGGRGHGGHQTPRLCPGHRFHTATDDSWQVVTVSGPPTLSEALIRRPGQNFCPVRVPSKRSRNRWGSGAHAPQRAKTLSPWRACLIFPERLARRENQSIYQRAGRSGTRAATHSPAPSGHWVAGWCPKRRFDQGRPGR